MFIKLFNILLKWLFTVGLYLYDLISYTITLSSILHKKVNPDKTIYIYNGCPLDTIVVLMNIHWTSVYVHRDIHCMTFDTSLITSGGTHSSKEFSLKKWHYNRKFSNWFMQLEGIALWQFLTILFFLFHICKRLLLINQLLIIADNRWGEYSLSWWYEISAIFHNELFKMLEWLTF